MPTIQPFSQGRAIAIIQQSVAHALVRQEPSREAERGTIIHGMVLGGASELVTVMKTDARTGVVEPATDYRTKSAQEHRDSIREQKKVPVLADEYETFRAASEAITRQLRELGFLEGRTEVPLEWVRGGVPCRGRLDEEGTDYIADLKTVENAAAQSSDSAIIRCGYDIQCAAYLEAVETMNPDLAGRLKVYLHFAEINVLPDNARSVITVEIGGSMLELGRARWNRARDLWRRAHESGVLCGYSPDIRRAEAPPWALASETFGMAETMEVSREPGF